MFRFPWTNLHELNLDWILATVKNLVDNNQEFNDKADYAVETADEAKQIAEDAMNGVLPDGAVTTTKIADYAVTQNKLAVNAVGNYQIQDGSVSYDKLESTLESDITGALSDISTLQTALTVTDEEFTINDIDNIINTTWRRKVFACGGFKVLTGSFTLSIPQDTNFHTIGSVSSTYYPAANTFMSFSQNINGTIEVRISTGGNIAIKNSNGSSAPITGMEISIVVPYI